MRALLTGVTGFTGIQLAEELARHGARIFGVVRSDRVPVSRSWPGDTVESDLSTSEAVRRLVDDIRPELVFHVASHRPDGLPEFPRALEVNVVTTANLLESVRAIVPKARVIVISSSAVYGYRSDHTPCREDAIPAPATFYGLSKFAQETTALQYHRNYGLRLLVVRPFNLVGPGEGRMTLAGAVAFQVAALERSAMAGRVRVGNLDGVRDFVDVRDAVRAYRLLAEHGRSGAIYNVCSGRSVPARHVVDVLVARSRVPVEVEMTLPKTCEPDIAFQVGDPARLAADTQWAPSIPLERSLIDVLDHCRADTLRAATLSGRS
jgi:GDP-4-dehydro-6-deoxy-D-mannose reductase